MTPSYTLLLQPMETFDSDILQRGQTFSYTFDKAGEYHYFCTVHPNMVGKLIVIEG